MENKHTPQTGPAPASRPAKVVEAERWLAQVRGLPGTTEQFDQSVDELLNRMAQESDAALLVVEATCLLTSRERVLVTGALARRAAERTRAAR